MTNAAKTFAVAIAAVTAAGAIGVSLANSTAAPVTEIAKLERVVVIDKRADATVVAKLPRVVIEGRHTTPVEATVAAAKSPAPIL